MGRMSACEITFLGTASQVPTRHRNHNGLFIRWDTLGILVDPGEGTQRQLLLAGIAATQITHILITHFHGDHCLGLAALSQRISLDKVPHPVEVIYPASGQVFFERLRYASIYKEQAQFVPQAAGAADGRRRESDCGTAFGDGNCGGESENLGPSAVAPRRVFLATESKKPTVWMLPDKLAERAGARAGHQKVSKAGRSSGGKTISIGEVMRRGLGKSLRW